MTDSDGSGMVDWDLAVRIGGRIAGDGPEVSRAEADAAVTELRDGANRSTGLVREFTGLVAEDDLAPVLVVDRPGWVQANAEAFEKILDPVIGKLSAKKGPSRAGQSIGSKVTAVEVGSMLGFLSSKVLGQFDPFHDPHGRLLLVAPNIVKIERDLEADPTDFRLWVCLHEETHRVQFTAVPWMRGHIFGEITSLADSLEPTNLNESLQRALGALRGGSKAERGSLLELIGTPEQKALMERMTGVMSLLEGHADVVMDGVGPSVIPSVAQIRKKFTTRRQGVGVLDKFLRRLLGLDLKMAQYRDGASFVRTVVDKVGMEEFNAVWAGPENLPTKAEIHDPQAWMSRVLG